MQWSFKSDQTLEGFCPSLYLGRFSAVTAPQTVQQRWGRRCYNWVRLYFISLSFLFCLALNPYLLSDMWLITCPYHVLLLLNLSLLLHFISGFNPSFISGFKLRFQPRFHPCFTSFALLVSSHLWLTCLMYYTIYTGVILDRSLA